jgi:hypothetical protein
MCFDEKLNKWALFKKFQANFVLTSNLEPEGNTTGNLAFISFWGMFTGPFQKTECPDAMLLHLCICKTCNCVFLWMHVKVLNCTKYTFDNHFVCLDKKSPSTLKIGKYS